MNIERFFSPRSIAVFGVSDSPGNMGKGVLENLNRFDFKGPVYGVGRNKGTVAGREVFASLNEIADVPDLALLLIPAKAVPETLRSCGEKGIGHAVIEAGGFSELAGERKDLEKEITEIARRWNITVMGPNCLGTMSTQAGLCTSFIPQEAEVMAEGPNSFVSQSGGLIYDLIRRCTYNNVGLNKLASIGNKLMIDENDLLQYLIHDGATGVIGMFLESVSNGRRLVNLVLETEKPVILIKGSLSPAGSRIAAFHTAALAGDEAVTHAAFRQAGIHSVESLEELVECFKVFSLPPMKGENLTVISRSGGQAGVLADQAYRRGFILPQLEPSFFDGIKEASAGIIKRTNPIDLGDVYNDDFFLNVVEMALKEKETQGVFFAYGYPANDSHADYLIEGVAALSGLYEKPVIFNMAPDRVNWPVTSFPIFTDSGRALDALFRSLTHWARQNRKKGPLSRLPEVVFKRESAQPLIQPIQSVYSLLGEYEIALPAYRVVESPAEALRAAQDVGYPVVLKRLEPFVLHKTEAGAVRLNIKNDGELRQAFDSMPGSLFLLQESAPDGVDTIIGGKRDREFGPVVLFGLGGIFVEIMNDVAIRLAPVDEDMAREMIEEIRGVALLKGARGMARCDMKELVRTIVKVSRLIADHSEIQNLDINPLRVFGEGSGCSVLDVKIEAF